MEDCLNIGIDMSKENDKTCMTIVRKQGRGYQVINQLFNEEAEEIYCKLINFKSKVIIDETQEKIGKNRFELQNLYSYKEILEVMDETIKLRKYYILNHRTSRKTRKILAVFWLTHTNDEFFEYFRFNWVPPLELQEEARTIINKSEVLNVPLIKVPDCSNTLKMSEVQEILAEEITKLSKIDPQIFLRGATNESEYK